MKVLFFTIGLISSLALADSIDCTHGQFLGCQASREANAFGTCPSGYQAEYSEARGQTVGVYCNRACSDAERETCNNKNCRDYLSACRPGTPVSCQLAVSFCDGKVEKKVCDLAGATVCQFNNKCQSIYDTCCPEGKPEGSPECTNFEDDGGEPL